MPLDRRSIPNALTVLRLVLAAGFFWMLEGYRHGHSSGTVAALAAGLFVVAAATDALDGHLARRWSAQSAFGRIMDPFADKILVLGGLLYLSGPNFLPPLSPEHPPSPIGAADASAGPVTGLSTWMVVVILARELLVTAIRSVAEGGGTAFGAKAAGKLKMILQSAVIPIMLLLAAFAEPERTPWAAWTGTILAWATVLATVGSGWPYLRAAASMVRTDGPEAGDP